MRVNRNQRRLFIAPRRSKLDDTREKEIQAACIQWLNSVPGVKMWRQNRGGMVLPNPGGGTRLVTFGHKGATDSTGSGPGGIRIDIEFKRPGKVPDLEQENYMEMIRSAGGISFWCDSLRSCVEQLRAEFIKRGFGWKESWECY